MKKILAAILLSALFVVPVSAKSLKRGVSENEFRYKAQLEALEPGVSWYYSWGGSPNPNVADFEGMEFIPMCWNAAEGFLKSAREYYTTHPEVKYILGYNEPNFPKQANLTPEEAAAHWPEVQAIAKEFGLEIVAPALNYSPGEWQPVPWMDRFVELVGADAFDYVAIHNYGGLGVMKDLAGTFHERYGKDVWVTEFCYWPGETGYVAPDTQISTMVEAVTWLEKTPWIKRYAWFKAVGKSDSKDSANYGLLISGSGDSRRELSEQGFVYLYMSDFDPEVYNPVGEPVAATEYIDATNIRLGRCTLEGNPLPIEISAFSTGATADYQFDVPEAGDYTFRLTVSGEGEPKRFDPNLAVFGVASDGKDGKELASSRKFSLPGDDAVYEEKVFHLTLEAGRQTLRLKDMAPFQPSGIRIANVALLKGIVEAGASVEIIGGTETDCPAEWYDLHGHRIDSPVTPGIYLERRDTVVKKIIIK